MRAETILKEASLYDHPHECYLHNERTNNSNFQTVISGDPSTITEAIYNVLCLLEERTDVSVDQQMKLMKKVYKRSGKHVPLSTGTAESA